MNSIDPVSYTHLINEKLAKALEDNTVTKDKLEDYMGKNGTAMDETNANGLSLIHISSC